jgi:hypothetical protein
MNNLSDEQWLVMDLLMRARQKGVDRLNRMELLHNQNMPQGVLLKLTWAALTMPGDLVTWHGQHDFSITEKGVAMFNAMFKKPTPVADSVICLPGPDSHQAS